jgi:hypothetical protein
MEGGIGYWSEASSYHWAEPSVLKHYPDGTMVHEDHQGFYADIIESEDETPHRIDRRVMAHGYRLATTTYKERFFWSSGEKPPLVVGPDTDWDFDATDADAIVQLGLFGDVRYG